MPNERRYEEEEVRRIFEAATIERETPLASAPPSSTTALTLRELQEIGRQAGIEPRRIAEAAVALEAEPSTSISRMSTVVRSNAPLPRAPTEAEWQMIVAELRATFDAHGRVGTTSGMYEWTNGNLRAYIEPSIDGYRLRMRTVKGSVLPIGVATGVLLAWSLAAFVGMSIQGLPGRALIGPVIVSVISSGLLAATLLPLPAWARKRREQMEHIARRARSLLTGSSGSESG